MEMAAHGRGPEGCAVRSPRRGWTQLPDLYGQTGVVWGVRCGKGGAGRCGLEFTVDTGRRRYDRSGPTEMGVRPTGRAFPEGLYFIR